MLWKTITYVLLCTYIFSLSESVEFHEDSKSLRDRVPRSTHICDCLKNTPPAVVHNNYKPLSDSNEVDNLESPGLAKDLSGSSYPVKRHATLRCYNRHAQGNKKLYKPDLIASEWQIKSTPVNNANSIIQKSKVVGLKKIDINSQKAIYHEPLRHTVPLLQKGNPTKIHNDDDTAGLIKNSCKHSNSLKLSPLSPHIPNNQKDLLTENEIFPPIPLIKFNKPQSIDTLSDICAPIAFQPTPSQLTQTSIIKQIHLPILVQKDVSISLESERPQVNIDSTSQYPKIIKNDIAKSTSRSILIEKDVSISLSDKKQQKSIDLPPKQSIKTSDIETAHKPIIIKKEVSISSSHKNEQESIDLPRTQFMKSSDTETINKPITIIEKKISFYFPHKKPQDFINFSPPKQFIKVSNTETVHEPIKIENGVSVLEPIKQKQPIVDLPPQTPQLVKTRELIYIRRLRGKQ